MKTIILFSSLFYLIGLKIGSTLEGIKNSILPAGSIITAPFKKSENSEKNYHYRPGENKTKSTAKDDHLSVDDEPANEQTADGKD